MSLVFIIIYPLIVTVNLSGLLHPKTEQEKLQEYVLSSE